MLRKTGASVAVNGVGAGVVPMTEEQLALRARPWAATGSMAVDKLLTWAIVEQRAGNSRAGLFEQEAAADAALRGQRFHWNRRSSDGVAKIEDIGSVGCRIDVSRGGTSGKVADVAEAVWLAAQASPLAEAVLDWAEVSSAPGGWSWPARRSWPRLGWVVDGVEGVTVYEGKGRTGQATPVVIVSFEGIMMARRRYQAWWDALEEMAWQLSKLALGFIVLPPSVERAPWQTLEAEETALIAAEGLTET